MRLSELPGQTQALAQLGTLLEGNTLPHALLLFGREGVGKLPMAQALAQRLLCQQPQGAEACGQCPSCSRASKWMHPDLHLLMPIFGRSHEGNKMLSAEDFLPAFREQFAEMPWLSLKNWGNVMDAANKQLMIPIHEVRNLQKKLTLHSFEGGKKVVVIWHADKMNPEASNSLLKLLEEPPAATHFILTVETPNDLLPTVLSRCQRMGLHRIPVPEVNDWLLAHQDVPRGQAELAASLADGSLSLALEMLNHAEENLSAEFIDWMRNLTKAGASHYLLAWAQGMSRQSREKQKVFLETALEKVRATLLYKANVPQLALAQSSEHEFLQRFSAFLTVKKLEQLQGLFEATLVLLIRNANANMSFYTLGLDVSRTLQAK
jgi:DNA polymerase III subunit delta'